MEGEGGERRRGKGREGERGERGRTEKERGGKEECEGKESSIVFTTMLCGY